VGCPRMTSGCMATSSSAALVEEDAPPDGPAELAGSSVATSSAVTLVAPLGNTLGAWDPLPVAACVTAPIAATTPVTRTPPPLIASSLGWASMVSWDSATWASPTTLDPLEGDALPEDGTLYVGETKLKSQMGYKKWQMKGRVAYRGFQEPRNHRLAKGVEPLGAAALSHLPTEPEMGRSPQSPYHFQSSLSPPLRPSFLSLPLRRPSSS
jgi:hypothetical protein